MEVKREGESAEDPAVLMDEGDWEAWGTAHSWGAGARAEFLS